MNKIQRRKLNLLWIYFFMNTSFMRGVFSLANLKNQLYNKGSVMAKYEIFLEVLKSPIEKMLKK